MCTRNDHHVEAGEPGRTLANGDLLRIEAVVADGLAVRRALDADPQTGQRRWTDRTFLYQDFRGAELGYAVTDHVAQGRTVHTGLAVITGTEDRQHAYVALSRGTDANLAYVFTTSPKRADLVPGPRPAPELARYDQIHAERDGVRAPAPRPASPGTALGVLASVLDRDGQQASATQTRQQALADADHLAVLHAIWTAETAPARQQRYRDLLAAALPARTPPRDQPPGPVAVAHPARRRTGRPGPRPGPGRRHRRAGPGRRPRRAAVLDARIRYRLGTLIPRPAGPWSAQVPAIADPDRRAYAAQIAALMDARKDRIGEHAAEHELPWAVAALGPVPARSGSPAGLAEEGLGDRRVAGTLRLPPPYRPDRARTRRGRPGPAGRLARGPRRPRPGRRAGRPRPARRQAAAPARHLPDRNRLGPAIRRRRAPPGPRRRLDRQPGRPPRHRRSQSRRQPRPARHRRPAAGTRQQLPRPARGLPATRDRVRRRHGRPGRLGRRHPRPAPPGRTTADAELRRRHPGQHYPPLRSAEPQPATQAQRDELTLTAGQPTPETGPVDQRPGRRAPRVRGHARRTAEPDRPVRGPRLRGPGPGVPAVARTGQGRHLAAAQTRDPPVPAGPPARRRPRRRPGGRRLTVPRCILGSGGDRDDSLRHRTAWA